MRKAVRWTLVATLGSLLWFGHTSPLEAAAPHKKASKNLLKDAKSHIKFVRGELAKLAKDYCDDLAELRELILDGSPAGVIYAVTLHERIGEYLDRADDLIDLANSTFESHYPGILAVLLEVPGGPLGAKGALLGDCGANEYLQDNLEVLVENFADEMIFKTKEFFDKLEEETDLAGTVKIDPPIVEAPEPHLQPPAVPPPPERKPLHPDAWGGSSNTGATSDGRICVSGTADPANGDKVTVTVYLANGQTRTAESSIAPGTCRWRVCIPDANSPGDLPEGNYRVDLTHGDTTLTSSKGIGVP